jgi:hypothetical protein
MNLSLEIPTLLFFHKIAVLSGKNENQEINHQKIVFLKKQKNFIVIFCSVNKMLLSVLRVMIFVRKHELNVSSVIRPLICFPNVYHMYVIFMIHFVMISSVAMFWFTNLMFTIFCVRICHKIYISK